MSEDGGESDGALTSQASAKIPSSTEIAVEKSKRTSLRATITRDVKKVSDLFTDVDDENVLEAKVLLSRLERHLDQVGKLDNFLLAYDTADTAIATEVERVMDYQMKLSDAVSQLKIQIAESQHRQHQRETQQEGQPVEAKRPLARVKTPKLELTRFDGDPLKYEEFWDDFSCTVDSRSDLSIIDKFKILKQCLRGEALSVADGYFLTQRNYQEVKDALKDRFGDPQVAIFAHFEALLELNTASHKVDELIKIRDKCEAHIRSLTALGLTEETFGMVFAPILLSKLPRFVKLELHRRNGSKKWTLTALREHLKEEIRARTNSDRGFAANAEEPGRSGKLGKDHGPKNSQKLKGTSTTLMVQSDRKGSHGKNDKCVFCGNGHRPWECKMYASANARITRIKGSRCFTCLSDQHMKAKCPKKDTACYYCRRKGHASSLCYKEFGRSDESSSSSNMCRELNPEAPEFKPQTAQAVQERTHEDEDEDGQAIFESAWVKVIGTNGSAMARVVFDNASSTTLIRRKLSRDIGTTPLRGDRNKFTSLSRVGEVEGKRKEYQKVKCEIQWRDGTKMKIHGREIEQVAAPLNLTPLQLDKALPGFHPSQMAEKAVTEPTKGPIDILLGLNYYNQLIGPEVARTETGLVVKESKFGKVVSGYLHNTPALDDQHHQMLVIEAERPDGMMDLERFWKLEDVGIVDKPAANDDEMALEHFNQTVKFQNGRYHVGFPFNAKYVELPSNKYVARRRLASVYRTLHTNEHLRKAYDEIFHEQLKQGIVEKAPENEEGIVHYLPHHAVVTPGKITTKVRVVFDASAKANRASPSLNECMLRGPVFLNDICGMLIRFRLSRFAITSDVEKAFLQIELHESSRECTRFFWLKDPSKPPDDNNLMVLRYARVPFGTKASPFLLAASIIHRMRTVGTAVASEIEGNTYMDNVLAGRNTKIEAQEYYREAKHLMKEISMNLREWYSNDAEFVQSLPEADQGKSKEPSVLGIRWTPTNDTIRCTIGAEEPGTVTKRSILKATAKVFDPCGWFSPVTIRGKMLMQALWQSNLGWDDPVPDQLATAWVDLRGDMMKIPGFHLPRMVSWPLPSETSELELHAFCDASAKAYATGIYLKMITPKGSRVNLIFAKARVAPLKQLTIPRLELMAALIAVRLLNFVQEQMRTHVKRRCLWSDSKCVLAWLRSPKVTSTFVENRLAEIRKSEDIAFCYVPTAENPADLPSRGISWDKMAKGSIWWTAPLWLNQEEAKWPDQPEVPVIGEIPENTCMVSQTAEVEANPLFDLTRFSTLTKLLQTTAYVARAVQSFKGRKPPTSQVTAKEIREATMFWEKRVQAEHLAPLMDNNPPSKWRNMKNQLGVYVDDRGLLRCGGRFRNASRMPVETRHPVLLPAEHPFTDLVIRDRHAICHHAGPKQTHATLRQRYWVPRVRNRIRRLLSECRRCRRVDGGPFRVAPEAQLPEYRVAIKRPFDTVGLDYIGPLYVSHDEERKKVWIALFTCAAMRAVHLEVVVSLTAKDFLLALRRFAAIYGAPTRIVSDNASQFKISNTVLSKLMKEVVEDEVIQGYAAAKGISWECIPERAPWMGGFYERLVAPVKQALKKSIGSWMLRLEELQTLVYEIASIINTRPMTVVDNDPSAQILTPAHLMFREKTLFPDTSGDYDPGTADTKLKELIAHWKAGQAVLQEFWNIWRDDYLTSLREQWKPIQDRNASNTVAREGTVVLIKELLPRGMWKLGKIVKLNRSRDGEVRSAGVKIANGHMLVRPLRLLYPLEAAVLDNVSPTDAEDADEDETEQNPVSGRRTRRVAAEAARGRIRVAAQD